MCPQGTESTCQWRQRLSWYFLQCPRCDTHQMPLKFLQVHKLQICQDDTPSSSPVAPITRWTLLAGLPCHVGWDENNWATHSVDTSGEMAPTWLLQVPLGQWMHCSLLLRPRWSFQVPATPQVKGRKQQFVFMFWISRKTAFKNKMGTHHELPG